MVVKFSPSTGIECWDYPTIQRKLIDLSQADKNRYWICRDLSLAKSSCMGRSFWKIAQHFSCLRSFYFIDPNHSTSLLEKIWKLIELNHDEGLKPLFFQAVANFEEVTGHHVKIIQGIFSDTVKIPEPVAASEVLHTHVFVPTQEPVILRPDRSLPLVPRLFNPFFRQRPGARRGVHGVNPIVRDHLPFAGARQIPGAGRTEVLRPDVPLFERERGPRVRVEVPQRGGNLRQPPPTRVAPIVPERQPERRPDAREPLRGGEGQDRRVIPGRR